MSKRTLFNLAVEFHERLQAVKNSAPPGEGLEWYPWLSLAAIEVLEQFVGREVKDLRKLTGALPALDIGCGDGDFAFFLEMIGTKVDAVDQPPSNYNAMVGVGVLKQRLKSQIGIHSIDMDARPNLPCANYGLTLMLGVLYHLKNPFLVLETLARHSRHIFLSTRVAALTPDRQFNYGALPMAYLVGEDELNQDPTNFWIFSEPGLKRLVERSGWTVLHYLTVGDAAAADPASPAGDARAYILAESRAAPPARGYHLERGWHELEYEIWRWTARRFGIRMEVPEARAPATVRFRFQLPEELLARRDAVTLRATVNGIAMAPRTFSTPGEHEYSGTVATIEAGVAEVEFELDSGLGPTPEDRRELGVMVNFEGLSPFEIE
jgi:SAM-dependent methyltransferase